LVDIDQTARERALRDKRVTASRHLSYWIGADLALLNVDRCRHVGIILMNAATLAAKPRRPGEISIWRNKLDDVLTGTGCISARPVFSTENLKRPPAGSF
jgi:hypothetical protein